MKKILLLLALSVGLRADIVGPTVMQELDGKVLGPITGSLTYALNQSLTGVASSAIDLSGTSGIYLTLTSTGSANVDLVFTNANLTTAAKVYTVQSNFSYTIPIRGRYLTIRNAGTNLPTARTSAFYYAAGVIGTGAGTGTISGTVTANQGTAGAAAWPVAMSVTSAIGWRTVSATTRTLTTGGVSLNLTSLAGVAGVPVIFRFSSLGPSAGFNWDADNGSTPVDGLGNYYAVSTTPIWQSGMTASYAGEHLHLSPAAAAGTITAKIRILVPMAQPLVIQ